MTDRQKAAILDALRHGSDDPELEVILQEDLLALEPLIDLWIYEARDYYFHWARHPLPCPGVPADCRCGLCDAIYRRRYVGDAIESPTPTGNVPHA